jgi:hypothetical protein
MSPKALVALGGGPSPVINASLPASSSAAAISAVTGLYRLARRRVDPREELTTLTVRTVGTGAAQTYSRFRRDRHMP